MHGGIEADVLEKIHQENLGGVPGRGQWWLEFEAPGILLDPPQKRLMDLMAQETSLVLGSEKWRFSALQITGRAFLENFGGQLLSGSFVSSGPGSICWV